MPYLKKHAFRRHERATLGYSYSGEFGRGVFAAMCADFAILVAVRRFGVTDKILLAVLSSAPFFGMLIALYTASMAKRHRQKSLLVAAETVSRALVIVAAFMTSGPAFVAVMALGIAMDTVGTPLINGLYSMNFRTEIRGPAVARLQSVTVGATGIMGATLGFVMQRDANYFRALLIVVSALSLSCSWYAYRLPEARRRREKTATGLSASIGDFIGVLKNDRAFLYIEIFWFLNGFANLWLTPVRVLRLTSIGFTDQQIMLATTATYYLTMVLTTGLWGRIMYRMNFAIFRMVVCAVLMVGFGIFFYSESFPMVCFGGFIWGLGLAGGLLSWRLIATFFTTRDQVPLYMSVHVFLCGVRGMVGPFLSLYVREHFDVQTVANISIGLMIISIVMLIPFIPSVEKRRQLMDERPAPETAG